MKTTRSIHNVRLPSGERRVGRGDEGGVVSFLQVRVMKLASGTGGDLLNPPPLVLPCICFALFFIW